ncbi:MAG TPA: glycosyltransferase family 1 protein [Pseudolysinimonas sp.]|jgi:glycosyltransferase involved in cell wall biosynthesis|nr:glycosyltransferase family 1 protein [Pseudolysinimonas sp.]
MSTLRVIVDEVIAPGTPGIGQYAEELTRELIRTAPRGSTVSGIVSASPEPDYVDLEQRLPGLRGLYKSPLARRELSAAWQHGFTHLPGSGMIHATSLLAPLHRHDRSANPGDQTVVTIHDAIAWTRPDLLPSRLASWYRGMGKRAERYADAVVVPTHAVADELADHLQLSDRVRVIGGAPATNLAPVADAAARRRAHGLPAEYLLTIAGWEPRKGLEPLIRGLADKGTHDIPLIIVGAGAAVEPELREVAKDAKVDPERVRSCDRLSPEDLSAILAGATIVVQPSLEEGFGLAMIEAFAFGRPVIHSDSPALVEVGAEAGHVVARDDADGYPKRLGAAIAGLLEDPQLRDALGTAAEDRSHAFSWRDSAEKVWQLHADL